MKRFQSYNEVEFVRITEDLFVLLTKEEQEMIQSHANRGFSVWSNGRGYFIWDGNENNVPLALI